MVRCTRPLPGSLLDLAVLWPFANKPPIWTDDEVRDNRVKCGQSPVVYFNEDTEVMALAIIPNRLDLKLIAGARRSDKFEGVLLFEEA